MENEIVESEVLEMEVELEVYDKVAAAVNEARVRCNNIVLCYDTPQDIKESKSFIYQLRQLKAPIAQAHKEGKAEALKFTRAMDVMKNKLTGIVEEMIEEKYAPIKVIEDAEKEKERIHEEEAAAIQAARVAKLDAKEAELKAKQEAFDRKEREARIAEEAKKEHEETWRQGLIDAENRRVADVQRAKDEAAAVAVANSAQLAALETIEREKKEADEMAETARINDEKHRSDVHREMYSNFLSILNPKEAEVVVHALIDGNIPHVTVNY